MSAKSNLPKSKTDLIAFNKFVSRFSDQELMDLVSRKIQDYHLNLNNLPSITIEVNGVNQTFKFLVSVPMDSNFVFRQAKLDSFAEYIESLLSINRSINKILVVPYSILNCSRTDTPHTPPCYKGYWSAWWQQ